MIFALNFSDSRSSYVLSVLAAFVVGHFVVIVVCPSFRLAMFLSEFSSVVLNWRGTVELASVLGVSARRFTRSSLGSLE